MRRFSVQQACLFPCFYLVIALFALTVQITPRYNTKWYFLKFTKWGRFFLKRLVLLLMLFAMLFAFSAYADKAEPLIQILPQHVDVSFSLEDTSYAYIKVVTKNDTGEKLLYSESGDFMFSMPLLNCYDETSLTIEVSNLNGNRIWRKVKETVEVEDERKPHDNLDPDVKAASYARDVEITMGVGGFDYNFRVPGREDVLLSCKSAQESHIIHLYAGEDYTYTGHVDLPLIFAEDTVTVSILAVGSSYELFREVFTSGYQPLPTVEKAAEGRLKGVTVCVDPGHQRETEVETVPLGPNFKKKTTTTVGMAKGIATNRREAIVVLEIGLMLRNALLQEGADVVMTRESQDVFVGMIERADIPNNANADFVLRLHCNNRSDERVSGIMVYCPYQSSYAMEVADEDTYREMGTILLDAMKETTGQTKGKCTLSNTYVGNNWSKMPSFLVEMGYMSNWKEDLLMSTSPEYQQKLVDGMVEGIYQLSIKRGLIEAPAQ